LSDDLPPVAEKTLTTRQLNRATLARQMLLARESLTPVQAVERLAGMQAQEPKPPFIGLWTRVDGFEPQQLRDAIARRKVVRATLMRGTLHLMSARDYRALRPALAPMLEDAMRVMGARSKGIELEEVLPVARDLFAGNALGFDEVRAELSKRFPDLYDRGLGYAVRLNLPLVMVPNDDPWSFGRGTPFTLAEEWLGQPLAKSPSPERLATSYLGAFGPASAADMSAWSGLRGTGEILDRMRKKLRVFRSEKGTELFDLPDAPRPGEDVTAPPRFLPEFDNLVLAHADRSRVIADEHRPLVATKNLRIKSVFLLDGVARGVWRSEQKRRTATLHLEPFGKLTKKALGELREEGEALLRFLHPDAETYTFQPK
jgi:hypothetical protein